MSAALILSIIQMPRIHSQTHFVFTISSTKKYHPIQQYMVPMSQKISRLGQIKLNGRSDVFKKQQCFRITKGKYL